ncbi:replicative DNA helicase [Streptomyces sp. NRRL WC-3742]|uniref:replicative DNA helicase n=1 Tax=Streptomyces sp. NRRL WC-3742 TaxID=1463934 RepID=UPI00099BF40C|nr:replicative DNA helicase [Streptomyces sp. NRRL WC-3742]
MSVPSQNNTGPDTPATIQAGPDDYAWSDQEPEDTDSEPAPRSAFGRSRHNRTEAEATDGFERVPPQDLAAEQSVLGGMMLSKDAIGDVIEVLKPADYYRPAHEMIHGAILELYGRGEPADPITVAGELTKRGELTRVGGASYLHTLVDSVPTAANAEYYAGIVHERAVLRRMVEAGTRIAGMGYAAEGDVDELVNAAQAQVMALADQRGEDNCAPLIDGMDITLGDVEDRKHNKGKITGVPTGFADLDQLTQGLQGGQMIVIAARPAIGKSTLALDIARSASITHGLTTAFFSLEMGRQEIQLRAVSAEGRVALHHLRSGEMTDDDWLRTSRAVARMPEAPLLIDDNPVQSALSIAARCRKLKQRRSLDLVVVDYLQLLQGSGRRVENRQQEVSDMSRNLKLLAKQLGVPVIALSQLNRGPEQRADKRPMISDLRESGSIEQDADVVILLHREDAYEKDSKRSGEADLIVAKHRNGPTATVTVAFQGHYSRFVDMARDEEVGRRVEDDAYEPAFTAIGATVPQPADGTGGGPASNLASDLGL